MQSKRTNTERRLTTSIVIIVLLSLCLGITTFALTYSMVTVEDNLFQMGTVKINLNDDKPIISEDEYRFEPGMTVVKDFFVENNSSDAVYYKLYFQNVNGGLADVLEVTITDADGKVLFAGTPKQLNRANVKAADDILGVGERRDLKISFHMPKDTGNSAQDLYLTFDIAAEAVQTRNNPNKEFN